jgi:hypothetical protein
MGFPNIIIKFIDQSNEASLRILQFGRQLKNSQKRPHADVLKYHPTWGSSNLLGSSGKQLHLEVQPRVVDTVVASRDQPYNQILGKRYHSIKRCEKAFHGGTWLGATWWPDFNTTRRLLNISYL